MVATSSGLPVAAVANVLLRYAHERYTASSLYAGEQPRIVLAPDAAAPGDGASAAGAGAGRSGAVGSGAGGSAAGAAPSGAGVVGSG